MAVWYINGVASDYYNIEDINLSFNNQDRDVATVTFHSDVEVPFWAYGTAIEIKLDSAVVFRGRLEFRKKLDDGNGESIQWQVIGAWWYFDQTVYGLVNYHTNGMHWTSRFSVGTTTLSAQVTNILNYLASLNYITVGEVQLPALTIPKEEVRDLTVAQALQRLLKWVPGSEVTFDYSAAKPVCHVYGPDAPGIQEHIVTIGTSKLGNIEFAPRDDRRTPNVVLQYDRRFSLRNVVYDPAKVYEPYDVTDQIFNPIGSGSVTDPDSQSDGLYEYVGIDQHPIGGVTARTLHKTILLSGSKRWRHMYYRQNNWTTGLNSLAWYRSHINNLRYLFSPWQTWMATVGQFTASDVAWSATPVSKVTGSTPDPNKFFPIFDGYQPPKELWRSDLFNDGYEVWEISHAAKWSQVSGSGEAFMSQRQYWFNAYSFNGVLRDWQWISRAIDESDTSLEAMPTGVAASMYNLLNKDFYDGRITIIDEEAVFLNPKARIANIAGYAKGAVQQISINAFTGSTTITFGPPAHLGPQDLIELLRVSRGSS